MPSLADLMTMTSLLCLVMTAFPLLITLLEVKRPTSADEKIRVVSGFVLVNAVMTAVTLCIEHSHAAKAPLNSAATEAGGAIVVYAILVALGISSILGLIFGSRK